MSGAKSVRVQRAYWDSNPDVPTMTGAATVMDCRDLKYALDNLGVDLSKRSVLDVGCGTGRLAALCGHWRGVDISTNAVHYCQKRGLHATLIDGPETLPILGVNTIVAFSVFTHIGRPQRRQYLKEFALRADHIVVDILPGAEGGGIPYWQADQDDFEDDLRWAGFHIDAQLGVQSPADGTVHKYYAATKRVVER